MAKLSGVKMWQLYCQDEAAGAEFRQLQSSQGAVRAWAWSLSRMLMRHLATQPQPLALSLSFACQPPLLDGHEYLQLTHTSLNSLQYTAALCHSLEITYRHKDRSRLLATHLLKSVKPQSSAEKFTHYTLFFFWSDAIQELNNY